MGVGKSGQASQKEYRPRRGAGTRPDRGSGRPGATGEEVRAARDRPSPALRIWARLPVRRGGPGTSGLRQLLLSPLPGDYKAGRDRGGEAPRGARQSRTVWALWARLSSSPGLTCQADYLRGRLIGEAGCNNNRFV